MFIFMGEMTQYARQAYLGTGPKGLLRATKGSKLPHPYRGITQKIRKKLPVENARASTPNLKVRSESHEYPVITDKNENLEKRILEALTLG